jgi:hydrogenase maturation protease
MSLRVKRSNRILIIGYGNPGRCDDGVGWYVAEKLEQIFHDSKDSRPAKRDSENQEIPPKRNLCIDVLTLHQLGIELIDDIKDFDVVVFIDAHIKTTDDIKFTQVEVDHQLSFTSHHLTPSMLLALTKIIYHKQPAAYIFSIKGRNFDFGSVLSAETKASADVVISQISAMINTLPMSHSDENSTVAQLSKACP